MATALRPMTAQEREALRDRIAWWGDHPVDFVLEVFGPSYEALHGEPLVPDPWQRQALEDLVTWPHRRHCYCASKNALKTCTLAWITLWLLQTRFDMQALCTSLSYDNLKAGLWKELAVWFDLAPILQAQFDFLAETIEHKERPETWFCRARSWAKDADTTQQAATLAGFHAKRLAFIADEVGDYPDGVIAAAEAIFAGKDVEAWMLLAGNPTQTSGPLYRAVRNIQGLYKVKRISGAPNDPMRCTRVSKEWAQAQIDEHGADHPWVKINVFGEFPDTQSDKLLGPDDLERAQRRNPPKIDFVNEPVIFGIDTADGGGDQTALCRRQGCVAFRLRTWRISDPMVQADQIAAILIEHKPDAVFIDLGGPSGHGITSRLKQLGFDVIGIDFAGAPVGDEPLAPLFANRRAEMAWKASKWVKTIGSLPVDPELSVDLQEPVYYVRTVGRQTKFLLEPKDEIKKRLKRSPDRGDALWLTFAAPVAPKGMRESIQHQQRMQQREIDPFAVLGGRA